MKVKLLSDTSCDLPEMIESEVAIDRLSLYVIQGETSYRDRIDITSQEIYRRMRQGEFFSTSQVTYHDFYEAFKKAAEAGIPTICLTISSGISGTYQSAAMAKNQILEDYPDFLLEVIDTLSVTGGLGLFVYYLDQKVKAGADFYEAVAYANQLKDRVRHVFSGNDLDYFYRGGRLSKTSAVLGNVLGIKPILYIDPKEGNIKVLKKTRTEKKLISGIIQYMKEHNTGKDLKDQIVIICHSDEPELADKMKTAIETKFGTKKVYLDLVAPVIGVHTGPGVITVFFMTEMV